VVNWPVDTGLSPDVQRMVDEHYARKRQNEERAYQQHLEEQRRRSEPPRPAPSWYLHRHQGVETICVRDFDQQGKRMIRGVASTATTNSHGWSKDPRGCQVQMPVPLVCAHHELGQIGDVTVVSKYPDKVVIHGWVWNNPAGDRAWALIESGEMRALSVGATSVQATVVDGVTYCDRWLLREVSIVRRPANPDCWLKISKQGER
jgi:hypothetical protein